MSVTGLKIEKKFEGHTQAARVEISVTKQEKSFANVHLVLGKKVCSFVKESVLVVILRVT